MKRVLLFVLVLWISYNPVCHAARILALFPLPSSSHSIVFHKVTSELARRGHDVVVFTSIPLKNNVPEKYKQIDMSSLTDVQRQIRLPAMGTHDAWKTAAAFERLSYILVEKVLSHPEMQRLVAKNNTETFDLVITEWLYWWGLNVVAHRFSAPLIGITSLSLNAYSHYSVGNPLAAAYIPDYNLGYTDTMNIWERFVNLYYALRQMYNLERIFETQDVICRKYLGEDIPPIRDVNKNVSLILAYTDPVMFYPQPNVPAIVEIGGLLAQSKKNRTELPEKLKSFLDEAENGFIYFSLGSTIRGSGMSDWTRAQFLEAFAELPYRVVWKWENDTLPGKPSNVYLSKWLPQQEVLAHPNIRVFLYQGGLQSTEETIQHAVPVVGIPLFVDQPMNVKKMESAGLGKGIYTDINWITKEEVKSAILEVINDPGYKERITKFRDLLNDRPQDILEKAVWWVEYVIRHKGAKHLRLRAMDMRWYQLIYLDVAALAFATLLLAGFLLYAVGKYVIEQFSNSIASSKYKTKLN